MSSKASTYINNTKNSTPVNGVIPINSSEELYVKPDDTEWLKSGITLETLISEPDSIWAKYPDATTTPILAIPDPIYTENSFSVANEDTFPTGITWDDTNKKHWVVGHQFDKAYEYDITGEHTGLNFAVNKEDTNPSDIAWDGTNFWMVGKATNRVYEYAIPPEAKLPAPQFSNNGLEFYVGSKDTLLEGLTWDGDSFWVAGNSTDSIYQYALENINLYAYTDESFNTSAQESETWGITWDGEYYWTVGTNSDTIYKYDSDFVYTDISLNVAAQDSVPRDIVYNPTTDRYWLLGDVYNKVYEYADNDILITPTLPEYTDNSFYYGDQESTVYGLTWDGTHYWTLGTETDTVFQYNFDGSYTGVSYNVTGTDITPRDMCWDGTHFWLLGDNTDAIYKYNSDWTYTGYSFNVIAGAACVEWDGTSFYITNYINKTYIYKYNNDGTTTGLNDIDVTPENTYPTGICWDGSHFWVADFNEAKLFKYEQDGTYTGINVDISNEAATPWPITWDGTNICVSNSSAVVFKYATPDPYISTNFEYTGNNVALSSIDTGPLGVDWDGEYYWVVGGNSNKIYKYNSDWIYTGISVPTGIVGNNMTGIAFDGTDYWVTSFSEQKIFKFIKDPENQNTITYADYNFIADEDTGFRGLTALDDTIHAIGHGSKNVFKYKVDEQEERYTYSGINFYVGYQTNNPKDVAWDGTNFWVIGDQTDKVYRYEYSTELTAPAPEFNGNSFYVGGEDVTPNDITYNSTKDTYWVLGVLNDTAYEYTTDGTYTGINFPITSSVTAPSGITYDSTNDSYWVVGTNADTVYEYKVPDLQPGEPTYTGERFTISSSKKPTRGIAWDGTYYWVSDAGNNRILKNNAGGSYAGTIINSISANGIAFDGTHIWVVNATNDTVYQYTLDGIATGITFSVANEDIGPWGIEWDGANLWVTGTVNDKAYKYEFPEPYPETEYKYTNESFSVTTQDIEPKSVAWDGTHYWVIGKNTNAVYQYDADGTYTGESFDISNEIINPTGITWDGNNFWAVDLYTKTVYQYSLSDTPTSVADFIYTGNNFSIDLEDIAPSDIAYDTVNSQFLVIGTDTDTIYEYAVSDEIFTPRPIYADDFFTVGDEDSNLADMAWDGSSFWILGKDTNTVYKYEFSNEPVTYEFKFISDFISNTEDTAPRGITWDGTHYWMIGDTTDSIYQYTEFGAYTGIKYSVGSVVGNAPRDLCWDGTYLCIISYNDRVYKFNNTDGTYSGLSFTAPGTSPRGVEWDGEFYWIVDDSNNVYKYNSDGSYTGINVNVLDTVGNDSYGIAFDGTYYWLTGWNNDKIYKYEKSGDTLLYTGVTHNCDPNGVSAGLQGICYNNNYIFVVSATVNIIKQFALPGTVVVDYPHYTGVKFSIDEQDGIATGISYDGDSFWVAGDETDTVYKYRIPDEFIATDNVYKENNFPVFNENITPEGVCWDGTHFWMIGQTTNTAYQYTPNGVYTNLSFPVNNQDISPTDIAYNPITDSYWVTGNETDTVYEYEFTDEPVPVSGTYTYANEAFPVAAQDNTPVGTCYDGSHIWIVGFTTDYAYQYTLDGTYTGTSFNVSQASDPRGIEWDGEYFWVIGMSNRRVYQYEADGTYTGTSYSVGQGDSFPLGVCWDGNNFWVTAWGRDLVYKYNSDWTYANFSFSTPDRPRDITFDGTYFWVTTDLSAKANQYNADGTNGSNSFSITQGSPFGICYVSSTGIFITDSTTDTVYKYSNFEIVDFPVYTGTSFSVSNEDTSPTGITYDPTNNSLWITGDETDTAY